MNQNQADSGIPSDSIGRENALADEPTSKLDSLTAALVRGALHDMARSRLVVVATHDAVLAGRADLTIDLEGARPFEVAA